MSRERVGSEYSCSFEQLELNLWQGGVYALRCEAVAGMAAKVRNLHQEGELRASWMPKSDSLGNDLTG